MSKVPWHLKGIRKLVYCALGIALLGIAISSALYSTNASQAWIAARQLYGLWALALLVASMLPGPLVFALPWMPFKAHLIMGRRALGISSFFMAMSHVACWLGPLVYFGNWRHFYAPGNLWICGLLIGLANFLLLGTLAATSKRKSIRNLGPRRWKALHRLVYFLLPAVLLHATFTGVDFGVNKGPDVTGDVDAGCLVGMLLLSLAWLTLFVLRKNRVRWVPSILKKPQVSG